MSTALLTHPDCADHVTPDGHPEQVARLRFALAGLEAEDFQDLVRIEAPLAEETHIARAHSRELIEAVKAVIPEPPDQINAIDADTWASPGSLNAALRGAGAVVKAVDVVLDGEAGSAFCAVRPPGHHAERDTAMGFCLFNNIAVGVMHALEAHGLSRVAVIDFDVHHGNGTEDILKREPRALFVSTHQWPLYPGTGPESMTGPHGNIVNIHLPAGAGGAAFRDAFENRALPPVRAFAPELIFISAGFDAHAADPLANLNLTERDFAWATDQICDLAEELCEGKIVSSLEGGYDLAALARSTAAHVERLMAHSMRRFRR